MISPTIHRALLLVTAVARLDRGGTTWVKRDAIYYEVGTSKAARGGEDVLRALARGDVLLTKYGPGGGYRLNRRGCPITVADVVLIMTPAGPLERDGPQSPWLVEQEERVLQAMRSTTIAAIAAAGDSAPSPDPIVTALTRTAYKDDRLAAVALTEVSR